MVFKRIGLLLFIVASPVCVSAAAADEGKLLLDRFLNDVRTMSARFEQSLIDADNVVVEESNGVLEIQRPGRFRWVYDQPYEQIMVADGLNVWSYDVDLAQVQSILVGLGY